MIFRAGFLTLAILGLLTGPAFAADSFCVSCSGPTASYICEVTMPDGVVPTQSPQLYCAYRLAAEGKHASCSSRRSGESPCPGDYRQLAYQGPNLVDPETPTGSVEPPPAEPTTPPASEGPATEADEGAIAPDPETSPAEGEKPASSSLVDLAEQVKEALGSGKEEAEPTAKDADRVTDELVGEATPPSDAAPPSTGDKIAGAAKTALNCLASWFEECE